MIFRIYHETAGGHVHMRVFAGPREGALGKCGDLCMRVDEFEVFRLIGIDGPAYACIDFQPEDKATQEDDRVVAVAEALWQQESIRAAGRRRLEQWADLAPEEQDIWGGRAKAAIDAFIGDK